ncbi:MAG: 2-amino-4-hydroxy-6-hydroxymethyldihydropteridine diphosphokinase [Clostridia bacterium]|nr:2-amino-4-hydroxy-6-hydroxymethyldihydropteridine diphosphokinase [Clostridia bacterium]
MSETAYVALGSNIGDGRKNIEDAVKALDSIPGLSVEAVSSMYVTKPWGYTEQNDFVNACARVNADISPEALLGACLGVEAGMGRIRKFTNGPRIIDIDVLLYGNEKRNTKELMIPHPRMNERDFVLVPLADIAEDDIKKDVLKAISELKEKYVID